MHVAMRCVILHRIHSAAPQPALTVSVAVFHKHRIHQIALESVAHCTSGSTVHLAARRETRSNKTGTGSAHEAGGTKPRHGESGTLDRLS